MTSNKKIDRTVLFSQCEFFIDYRSSQTGCDRSLHLANELESKYGANIVEYPNPSTTTHLIFKNGNIQTKLFAQKYNLPLINPIWLEHSIKKRRLLPIEKYRISFDENQQIQQLDFDHLTITNQQSNILSTPKTNTKCLTDANLCSERKVKKVLYTPNRVDFDQGNPEEYFDNQRRIITLDNLGLNLPNENHRLIHRYGCSVVRRQNLNRSPIKNKSSKAIHEDEKSINSTVLSQSQSSPIIHFTNTKRPASKSPRPIVLSPATTFDLDSQQQLVALGDRPQSTPKSSPILRPRTCPSNRIRDHQILAEQKKITPLKTADYSSFTKITPLATNDQQAKSKIVFQICDDDDQEKDDFLFANAQQIIDQLEQPINENQENCLIPRPPPLLALSQAMQRKHPDQLIASNLIPSLPSKQDLPNSPANYSFVFYGFNLMQLEEAKRLARRMGDCFSSETIDMTTTHIILLSDDPQISISLDFILGLVYGCRFVTFDWLKNSAHTGEWLHVNQFEPKKIFLSNPSLNIYRRFRQQRKPIQLFHQCGQIYLTSLVKQRQLILKLLTLFGANITINRNLAQIVVGQSSKTLPFIVYPQITEQWVIDSIHNGNCLSTDLYLIDNANNKQN